MVLINLGSLSDSELRYIARQENFDDWETADREDLIERLQEAYEEQDDVVPENDGSGSAKRYITSLTDFGTEDLSKGTLPGVEGLPKAYNDTCLHMMLRNPQWAFVFWSISGQTRETLDFSKGRIFLRVLAKDLESGKENWFDIAVSPDDREWNINFPQSGASYTVVLYYQQGIEMRELARSRAVSLYKPYWNGRWKELAHDPKLFSLNFDAMVSRQGVTGDNPFIQQIAEQITEEVVK